MSAVEPTPPTRADGRRLFTWLGSPALGCVLWTVLLGMVFGPLLAPRHVHTRAEDECWSRLHQLSIGIRWYRQEKGCYPGSLKGLVPGYGKAEDLACPTGGPYVLLPGAPAHSRDWIRCDRHVKRRVLGLTPIVVKREPGTIILDHDGSIRWEPRLTHR